MTRLVARWARLQAFAERSAGLVPLVLRVSVGIAFAVTGWAKLNDLETIVGYFRSLGIPAAELQAPFVAGLEFVGGLALLFGLGSRLFAAPLMGTMVVAILTAKRDKIEAWSDLFDFVEWHYLVFFFAILVLGAGPFSLDALVSKKLKPATASSREPSPALALLPRP